MQEKIICIVGPTASGKTNLSINLAKKIDAEIISADSMQIYKKLNIGTAKVRKDEAQGIKHHIIDICDVYDNFSVADFKQMCYDKIKDILSRGKKVIITGGTGLYVSAVVDNMQFEKLDIDKNYREELEKLAKQNSPQYLYDMLKEVDPQSAKEIHPNNLKRVIRALEIAKNSGKLKSQHMQEEIERKNNKNGLYQFVVFCIDWEREQLYERINKRVDIMINQGVINEAKYVYNLNLESNCTCMQAIGYKEFFPYFKGEKTLEECVEKLKIETRKYAKRQMTWFRNKLKPIYLDATKDKDELIDQIIGALND